MRARRYVQFAKDTFPEHSARRSEGGRRLRERRRLSCRARRVVEARCRGDPLSVMPDGININHDCGSTHPRLMQETVVASGADIGLALDGDADRLIVSDENGQLVDGDQLMALIALGLKARGGLKGDAVVATIMSNLGLERSLGDAGLKLLRTKVGDRYVLEEMRAKGCNVGGSNRGTSSLLIMPPPATGWSRGSRCSPRSSRQKTRERTSTSVRTPSTAPQERAPRWRRRTSGSQQRPKADRCRRIRAGRPRPPGRSANRAPSR